MASRNDAPLSVQVPRAAEDRPAWGKVGIIAVLGFAVGVAWPKIAGVRLGPSAPADATVAVAPTDSAKAPEAASAPLDAAIAPSASVNAAMSASAATSAAPPMLSGPPVISVPHGVLMSCKTADGQTLKGAAACGALSGFDAIAMPRIKKLGSCSGADGQTGKLSVVLIVNFEANKVDVDIGRSSTLQNLDTLSGCLRTSMQNVSLGAIEHDNPRYTIYYNANFAPPNGSAPGGSATATQVASASAEAPVGSVVWDVAIVRDTPRTGQVVARLQRGTKIRVGGGQDGWYRVKYGTDFGSDGWVYRGAIGK